MDKLRRIITIIKPSDFHHHLRQGDMLSMTTNICFDKFHYGLAMPNLNPPIFNLQQALDYRRKILEINHNGTPLMTLYMNPNITDSDLDEFSKKRFLAGVKYYPKAATTNSNSGVSNINDVSHVLKMMESKGVPLLIHGESIEKGVDIFHKERVFLMKELSTIVKEYPNLRIVLEHITTEDSVNFVLEHNIHATITPHHMLLDRNDIFKGGINPHHYCLPILKKSKDREALVKAATSGKHNFFMGTDSAPHYKENKLSCCGCAGIFNSPVAIEVITQIFEEQEKLEKLEKFISTNGCDFYGLTYPDKYIDIEKIEWDVPYEIDGIVPLCAGKTLKWKVSQNDQII